MSWLGKKYRKRKWINGEREIRYSYYGFDDEGRERNVIIEWYEKKGMLKECNNIEGNGKDLRKN